MPSTCQTYYPIFGISLARSIFLTSVLTTSSEILNICGDFTGNSPKGMLRLTALKLLPSMRGSPTKLRSAMIWDFMSGTRMTKTS